MVCMQQLNLNVTPDFERDLERYMKQRGIATKSDAIRQALREAVARAGTAEYDYREWLGLGLRAPLRRKRRFQSEDDLWS
jgi:metal-responsive CopG/Arc/MetJ family transcriptional regulator